MHEITKKEKQEIKAFNQRVFNVQELIFNEAVKIDSFLKSSVDDVNDTLQDYELNFNLYCCLKEDDPKYRDDDDNFLVTITERLKQISHNKELYDFRWNKNINHSRLFPTRTLANMHQSWLFHTIYETNYTKWQDILRIGTIWSDIIAYYKYVDKEDSNSLKNGIKYEKKEDYAAKTKIITDAQKDELRVFNQRLTNLQDKIFKEAVKIDSELRARVEDENDPLDDYEIELYVAFHLKEDDPEFKDNDYLISSLIERLKDISSDIEHRKYIWDKSINHSDLPKSHYMSDIFQCWFFHSLSDHNHIEWLNILRIGTIEYEIEVKYQYFNEEK